MNATVTIDKAGRIVLPKPMRDELQLRAGDSLEVESSEGQVTLRPARSRGRLYKKQGVWVFSSGSPLTVETVNETIEKERRERENRFLGKSK